MLHATAPAVSEVTGGRQLSMMARPSWRQTASPLADVLQAERFVLQVRWLGIAAAALALPFLNLGVRMGYVLAGATLYNLVFQFYVIPHRSDLLERGYLTTAGDALLSGAAILVTHGIHSEFFLVYFLVAVVAAIRFGGGAALVSTGVALASYTAIVLALGAPVDGATAGLILVRISFVGITGVFVGFIGDRARAAEKALERELDQAQQLLTEATAAIASDLDLEHALQAAADWLLTLSGGLAAAVRLELTEEVLEWVAADQDVLADEGRAVRQGGERRLAEVVDLARAVEPSESSQPDGNVRVSMVFGAQMIGTMAVALPPGSQVDDPLNSLLVSFAERAAAALVTARSYALMRRQASTDATTGIANHRRFKQRLLEIEELAAEGRAGPTSLIMIDLDFFKEYNDSHGHQAGDRILRCVAKIFSDSATASGLAARYGGDEFVILLPDTEREAAMTCAERMLADFNRAVQEGRDGLAEPVSLSAGVATLPEGGGDYQVLIGRADLAMYMAKRAGGGSVHCFEDEAVTSEPLQALMSNIAAHLHRTRRRARGPRGPAGGVGRALSRDRGPVRPSEAIRALVAAISAKDPMLHVHCRNVARLSIRIGRSLGLSDREVQDIGIAGLLHDVGKIGVSDAILHKPGKLDSEEFEAVHRHAIQGAEILDMVPGFVGVTTGVKHHHEQYDGHGYPGGLAGEAIPVAARIVAVADAYDAITADRPYRKGRTPRETLRLMLDAGGTQFDPHIVAALVGLIAPQVVAVGGGRPRASTTGG